MGSVEAGRDMSRLEAVPRDRYGVDRRPLAAAFARIAFDRHRRRFGNLYAPYAVAVVVGVAAGVRWPWAVAVTLVAAAALAVVSFCLSGFPMDRVDVARLLWGVEGMNVPGLPERGESYPLTAYGERIREYELVNVAGWLRLYDGDGNLVPPVAVPGKEHDDADRMA